MSKFEVKKDGRQVLKPELFALAKGFLLGSRKARGQHWTKKNLKYF
jgi:hypothetical protein